MTRKSAHLAVAAAVTLGLAACQSTAGSSGNGTGGGPAPSLSGEVKPAVKGGYCILGPHTITSGGGLVAGRLDWECHGSVLMQLTVRLIYVGNNAEVENEVDEGQPVNVDNIIDFSPTRLNAPCVKGGWKMKIVGTITPAIGPTLTVNTSDKTKEPFNDPKWRLPIPITC